MGLVDYSSSEEDKTEERGSANKITKKAPLKRKREQETPPPSNLPPLPSKFHDLYASTTRVSTRDDPSLHGGRKRVTPHIEGNWPTHIYVEWYPSTTEHGLLTKLVSILKDAITSSSEAPEVHSFLTSDLGAPLPLHISLSRPIGFLTDQKDTFLLSLERSVKQSGIRPFNVSFSGLDWVANFEKTRWFLVLRLQKQSTNELNRVLHVANTIVQDHGQPPLYAKPFSRTPVVSTSPRGKPSKGIESRRHSITTTSTDWSKVQNVSGAFHISIAWSLSAPTEGSLKLTTAVAEKELRSLQNIGIKIEEIKAKVGNAVTSIPLAKAQMESKAVFGF